MSLRARTIRLAKENAKLRPHLLKILAADEDDDKAARFTEGPQGKKEFDAWIKKQPKEVQDEWAANKEKYKDKFKSAAETLYMTVVDKRAGCEKLPEGPMRDNCEKKKDEGGEKKDEGGEKKDDKEAALRAATIRLAHENPKLRPHLLEILAGKAPAKLKGKKLQKEIDRLFYKLGDGVQFNIMDLGKLSNDVKKAYEAGEDMEAAMKKAIAKYRKN